MSFLKLQKRTPQSCNPIKIQLFILLLYEYLTVASSRSCADDIYG